MALIVVMEDDAGTRLLVSSVLTKDGHHVLTAQDGIQGLATVRTEPPDLVISDVQMPGMNGFEMLAAMRADPALATIPVILLTSLQERAHMRIGMTTGADDYITKPFRAAELRQAVSAQLNKRAVQASLQALAVESAVTEALEDQRHELAQLYEQRLAAELSERWPQLAGENDERIEGATVLFADIPDYAAFAAKLDAGELAQLVRRFYGNANDAAHLFGARTMRFVGEGLLAVFAPEGDTQTVSHALRAVRTALGLLESAHGVQRFIEAQFPGRGLPPFAPSIALHTGQVALTALGDPLHGSATQLLPVGDAVSTAMQLQKRTRELGWSIAATVDALRSVTGGVRTGGRSLVELPGRAGPLDVVEILGLGTDAAPAET